MKILVKEESNIPASIFLELPCCFDEWVDIPENLVLDILCKIVKLMKNVVFKATVLDKKYLIDLRAFNNIDKDSTIWDTEGNYTTLAELVSLAKKIKLVDSTGREIVRFRKN